MSPPTHSGPPAAASRGIRVRLPRGRWLERSLVYGGLALLAGVGGVRLTGELQRQHDLAQFKRAIRSAEFVATATASPAPISSPAVDTRLWAPERIRAYEESLRRDFGAPLAVLAIPGLGLEVPVHPGTDDATLNRGVGLIAGTARPGEGGNVGIAGHRDGFFRGLKDIAIGDSIELRSLGGRELYVVESLRIVEPSEVWVLAPTPSPALTLVTCYPFYFAGSAPQRFIVRATRRDGPPPAAVPGTRTSTPDESSRKEVAPSRDIRL